MPLVTKENADRYPVPVGSLVKWASWKRWRDVPTQVEFVSFSCRTTDPLPEHLWPLAENWVSGEPMSYVTFLPLGRFGSGKEVVEAVPETFPFKTFYLCVPVSEDGLAVKVEGSG